MDIEQVLSLGRGFRCAPSPPVKLSLGHKMISMIKYFIYLFLILFSSPAFSSVELSIVIPTGYVAFTVEDHWSVLNMQTKLPVTASVFQIPNNADKGTPASTNLIISIHDPKSPIAQKALKIVGQPYGSIRPKEEQFNDWVLYWQEPMQGNTVYSVVDARRDFKNVVVTVRLAWPHLKDNPTDYNMQMNNILRNVLRSVREHKGLGNQKRMP